MRNTSFWGVFVPRAMSIYAIIIFVALWAGFIIAMVVNRGWLDMLWSWAQALPPLPRIVVWLLMLPIMVGLWIWKSSGPDLIRILGFAGIAGWTLLALSSLYRAFR